MWEFRLECKECAFAATILRGRLQRSYFCQTCRAVMRVEEPRLEIQPLACPQCSTDLLPVDRLSPGSSVCPSCGEGSLDVAPGAHLLVDCKRSEPYVGQTVHGQVVAKGTFVQLALFNEPNWRARFQDRTPQVGAWVEAKVLEIRKKTLVCEFLRELPQELLSYKDNWITQQ